MKIRKIIERLPLSFTPYALLYPILLTAALLFAQGLKMPISHMLFIFVLLLPISTAVQLVIARMTLKVSFRVATRTPRKRSPILINTLIKNRGLLPYSLVEVSMTVPGRSGEHLEERRFVFSLLPFSSCTIDRSVEFAFRGEWCIGVDCIYVYDFMRAVRLRIPVKCRTDVFVVPRLLMLEEKRAEVSGELIRQQTVPFRGTDNTEPEDIRAYRIGDSRRSVHWKLSSKSEELLVKAYANDSVGSAVVLCSLEPFTSANRISDAPRTVKEEYSDTADLYCTDLAVELSLAAVRRELEMNTDVILAWMENGVPAVIHIKDEAELDVIFRRFGAAQTDSTENQFSVLADAVGDTVCSTVIAIGAVLDKSHSDDCRSALSRLHTQAVSEFRLCAASCMFSDSAAENDLHERIKELENDAVDVIIARNT